MLMRGHDDVILGLTTAYWPGHAIYNIYAFHLKTKNIVSKIYWGTTESPL